MKLTIIFDIETSDFISNMDDAIDNLRKKNHSVEIFDLNKTNINFCIGCFGCWVKNPGKCVFDDDMTHILKSQMASDWVLYFSSMKSGTLGYKTKNAIDRSIPLVLPHIGVFEGEFHHKKRYEQYPNRAFLVLDDQNANETSLQILNEIAEKNAKNMHCDQHIVKVFDMQRIEESINEIIDC